MHPEESQPSVSQTWHRVADVDELSDGALKAVVAAGRPLVLIRIAERYGVLDGHCPHAGGPLAEGMLENGRLICPWHGREYNPLTGQCDGYDQSVRAYEVDMRADGVYVAL